MTEAAKAGEAQRGKAVAKRNGGTTVAPPTTENAAIIAMLERAARDPAVDIDKMERLFLMRERMAAQQAKTEYLAALAEMQPELPTIAKLGTINANEKDAQGVKTGKQKAMTKYAKWEDVVEGITPWLFAHGFSLSFRIAQPTPERIVVTGVLGHRGGHSEETSMALPIDSTGAKNNVQGWGSSVSYGKRYTAFALLNISARGEDDDGKAAGAAPRETINEAQEKELRDIMKKAEVEEQIVKERFNVETLADLTLEQQKTAVAKCKKKLELM